jgi:hypothetical protein
MPSVLQIVATLWRGSSRKACAMRRLSSLSNLGRPPCLPCAGGLEACAGALPDQGALKLRQGREDMEHQLPSARGRIDGFGDALKSNAYGLELLNRFNQLLERAAKPIQPPNHEGIARAQRFEQAKQFRPVHFAPVPFLRTRARIPSAGEHLAADRGSGHRC